VPDTGDEVARLAQTLNAMLDRLEEAFGRERRFVNEASHELRTPLGILKGELDLALSRPRSTEELEAALRAASAETDHLSELAEGLLVLSRANRGWLPVRRSRVDLGALLEEAVMPLRGRAEEARVEIDVQASSGRARVDPVRVRQAVTNLLDNSLRYVPMGGCVSVGVTLRGDEVQIVVEDSGPGFPEGFLERAFEPFSRSPQDEADPRGAGLGLAIVRAIAEAHGGTATAENRPDGGARVIVNLKG
jgi:signal transduction histidine kinase